MRGKDEGIFTNREAVRITPAYAGKSVFTPFLNMAKEDHPRVCGEKSAGSVFLNLG